MSNGTSSPFSDFISQRQPFTSLSAVVTGGTTGIGRAIAKLMAKGGGAVGIFGRHRKELDEALNAMKGLPGKVVGLCADQSKAKDVKKVFAFVKEKLPPLSVLVNNAGIADEDLREAEDEIIDSVIATNVKGYLYCARRAIAAIIEAETEGHIINIGSINAESMDAGGEIYTASKGAIRAFSESLRKTLQKGKQKIAVSLIEPGLVGTDMVEMSRNKQVAKQNRFEMLKAEDVADLVAFVLLQPRRCVLSAVHVEPLASE